MPGYIVAMFFRRVGFAAVVLFSACARPVDFRTLSPEGFIGQVVAERTALPRTILTDDQGNPYQIAERDSGKVVLLFFGYMHCPDICPVHLANLGAVLDRLPDHIVRQIRVIFVTTDPIRDSLSQLGPWVRAFHPGFVALSGSASEINAAQREAGVRPAERGQADSDGNYPVVHAAQLVAYTRDGLRLVEYPFGTRQADWAHDLPLLVNYGKP